MAGLALLFWIIQLGFALLVFFLTVSFVTGAPFVPTASGVSRIMIKMAGIRPGMKVYDLGSGDGRLLFSAVAKGAYATGYEINPFLVLYTRLKILVNPRRAALKVYWKNFWSADVRDADIIFIYLVPWRMEKLKRKLLSQLKPDAVIVSNSFIFRNWKVLRSDMPNHIYVFRAGDYA